MTNSHLELSFVCEDSFGSELIRWGTHSDYSHVDIITPDGYRIGARTDHPVQVPNRYNLSMYHIEAGVQKRDMNYSDFTRDDRLIIPCKATAASYAYCWLLDQIGKPYDKIGLFRSFFLNMPDTRPVNWRDEDQWWCSELAAVFIEKAGFPPCKTPANRMSPNDTYIYGGCFAK